MGPGALDELGLQHEGSGAEPRDQERAVGAGDRAEAPGGLPVVALLAAAPATRAEQAGAGQLLDADAFVRADIYAGLGINGSVSQAVAPKFCWDLCEFSPTIAATRRC